MQILSERSWRRRTCCGVLLTSAMLSAVTTLSAQIAPPKAVPVEDVTLPVANDEVKSRQDLSASLQTQKEARTLRLSIPAPRGQIVDRHGLSFAQNRVVQFLALNFPFMQDATPAKILEFAHSKFAAANRSLGKNWSLPDDKVLNHYEHRRWLPLVFSIEDGLNIELTPEQQEKVKPLLANGLLLQPAYQRFYPRNDAACHVIGYTGKTRPLPVGPIADGDPLFEEMEGREGLEVTFDTALKGQPGEINVLFDRDGKLLSEEVLRRPVQGRNVVTTLDFNLQKYAENSLKKNARNGGSMVIMDVRNGDILAMASNPGFDLNEFIPGIRRARFDELSNDPRMPLFPRSFRGEYPPASTFKIVTALGALESGSVTATTSYSCDSAYAIGDRVFKNWNKEGEGSMNVIGAIKRSCNTWFYQAALQAGADPITNMALRMGFGERTGIPLKAEANGFVPTNAFMIQRYGYKILPGDLANIAIGQGRVLVTPLQVCQCMAALGDGINMPQPRLVKQVQTLSDVVVDAYEPSVRKRVDLPPEYRDVVVKGMVAVVNAGGGTGHAAAIDQAQIAGKTGTAQWKVAKDQNLAWFTGFLPASQPTIAFAVVYEGAPGEDVSGGRKAAPIVSEVFSNFYKNAPTDDPLVLAMKDAPKALPVDEGTMDGGGSSRGPSVETRPAEQAPPPETRSLGGFFRRLFRSN